MNNPVKPHSRVHPLKSQSLISPTDSSKAVCEAASKWGIFQVVNHGIPNEVINELQRVGMEFFELTQEVKEVYAAVPGSLEGYGTSLQKEVEGKKAWTDYLFHNIWPPSAINFKFWPKNPPAYRKANEEYAKHLRRVVDDLLWNLSTGLNLEKHAFKDALGGEDLEMLLKINYYPPCPRPDLALGVVAHTDLSAVTVLVPNDVPGLQFFKDDHWFCVKYVLGALIIHIGDQIEILSNGKYKSVLHRATVNKDKTRISWPVFCSPPMEKAIGPLPQLITSTSKSPQATVPKSLARFFVFSYATARTLKYLPSTLRWLLVEKTTTTTTTMNASKTTTNNGSDDGEGSVKSSSGRIRSGWMEVGLDGDDGRVRAASGEGSSGEGIDDSGGR